MDAPTPDFFEMKPSPQLVKFLSRAPVAAFYQHWVDAPKRRSWTCLGDDCPLCNLLGPGIGDVPTLHVHVPVLNFSVDPEPKVQILKMTSRILAVLHAGRTTGPIEERYYTLERHGAAYSTPPVVVPFKPRDLEDFGIDPDQASNLVASAVIPDDSFVPRHSREDLAAVARLLCLPAYERN